MPRASQPGRGIVHAAARLANGVDGEGDRRAESRARGLGEDADHVVPRGCRAKAAVPPEVVGLLMRDPRHAGVVQCGRHLRADEIHPRNQGGIEIRIDGILERRDEETHAVRAHLVHVVYDLREPFLVQHACDETRLDLRQHEPVAVVVVAHVLMVQPRQRAALVARALVPPVPAHDRVEAVGIHRRNHQHNHGVEQPAQCGIGGQPIGECHPHLTRRHFRGMDVAADQDHSGLPAAEVRERRIRELSRVREQPLGPFDLGEALLIGRCGDRHQEKRSALGRAAQGIDAHIATLLCQTIHVPADLLPIREHRVGAGFETESGGWADGRFGGL